MAVLIVSMPNDYESLAVQWALRKLGTDCDILYTADLAGGAEWSYRLDAPDRLDTEFRGMSQCFDFQHYSAVWMRRPNVSSQDRRSPIASSNPPPNATAHNSCARCSRVSSAASSSPATSTPRAPASPSPSSSAWHARSVCRCRQRSSATHRSASCASSTSTAGGWSTSRCSPMPFRSPTARSRSRRPPSSRTRRCCTTMTCLLHRASARPPSRRRPRSASPSSGAVYSPSKRAFRAVPPHCMSTGAACTTTRSIGSTPCPQPIIEQSVRLLRELGLVMGMFDFILDREGNYHFLEVNPQGQFLWTDQLADVQLNQLEGMAQFLLSKDPDFRYTREDRVSCADFDRREIPRSAPRARAGGALRRCAHLSAWRGELPRL